MKLEAVMKLQLKKLEAQEFVFSEIALLLVNFPPLSFVEVLQTSLIMLNALSVRSFRFSPFIYPQRN